MTSHPSVLAEGRIEKTKLLLLTQRENSTNSTYEIVPLLKSGYKKDKEKREKWLRILLHFILIYLKQTVKKYCSKRK